MEPAYRPVLVSHLPSVMARGGTVRGLIRGSAGRSSSLALRYERVRERDLQEVRDLAYLMDNSLRIPLIGYRFGVDAILGLVPVIGDFSSFGFSGWIIYRAARMGAPKRLLVRMLLNSLGDAVFGSIPILGTVVDVVWKANSQNLRLLERFLAQGR